MRRPRYIDFECPFCSHREERFVETHDDGRPIECETCMNELWSADPAPADLGVCGAVMQPIEIGVGYVKTIVKGNADFAERERERLEKRSSDHWKRKGKDEAIQAESALMEKYRKQAGYG